MRPDGERLVAQGVVRAIVACAESGLLDALERGERVEDAAARLGLDARAARLVAGVLDALGHLDEAASDDVERPGRASSLSWPDVLPFLRTGETTPFIDDPTRRGESYARGVIALGEVLGPSARELAERLAPVRRILDVGAGSGVWSLAMAARSPDTEVVGLDLPEVTTAIRLHAATLGLDARVTALAGDWLGTELEGRFDRVVLANVLHLEDEAGAASLIRRAAELLEPDGELVVVDFLGDAPAWRRLGRAVYALHLGTRTRVGRPHAEDRLRALCAEAGLPRQQLLELERSGLALGALVCRRAGDVALRPADTTTLPTSELDALHARLALLTRRTRLVFDGARDPLVVIRHHADRIAAVNEAFRQMFGVDWPAGTFHDYRPLFAPDDRPRFEKVLRDIRDGRVTSAQRYRFTMVRSDGTRIDAELTAFDPGYPTSASFSIRDRAELARQEKLEALGALTAGMAHDINSPLAVLASGTDVAAVLVRRLRSAVEAGDGPRVAELLDDLEESRAGMRTAVERIGALVRSVQSFATLEGASLRELAPSFGTSVTRAIADRIRGAAQPPDVPGDGGATPRTGA